METGEKGDGLSPSPKEPFNVVDGNGASRPHRGIVQHNVLWWCWEFYVEKFTFFSLGCKRDDLSPPGGEE